MRKFEDVIGTRISARYYYRKDLNRKEVKQFEDPVPGLKKAYPLYFRLNFAGKTTAVRSVLWEQLYQRRTISSLFTHASQQRYYEVSVNMLLGHRQSLDQLCELEFKSLIRAVRYHCKEPKSISDIKDAYELYCRDGLRIVVMHLLDAIIATPHRFGMDDYKRMALENPSNLMLLSWSFFQMIDSAQDVADPVFLLWFLHHCGRVGVVPLEAETANAVETVLLLANELTSVSWLQSCKSGLWSADPDQLRQWMKEHSRVYGDTLSLSGGILYFPVINFLVPPYADRLKDLRKFIETTSP